MSKNLTALESDLANLFVESLYDCNIEDIKILDAVRVLLGKEPLHHDKHGTETN